VVFLKRRASLKWKNTEFVDVSYSLLFLCAAQTSHCRIVHSSLPSSTFLSFMFMDILDCLPGGSCLGLLGFGCSSGGCNSSELDSAGFFVSDL
jgi:hypothetical protein